MAVILATVDIEDLATAKVAGIKDALTDLVVSQQQIAAASGAMTGSLAGSWIGLHAAGGAAGRGPRPEHASLAQQFAASAAAAQQGLTGIEAYLRGHSGSPKPPLPPDGSNSSQYVAVLGGLSEAATASGGAPEQPRRRR